MYTENGAISYNDLSSTIKLFYHSVRGVSKVDLITYLDQAVLENFYDTIVLCFFIRDCRGGKGERQLGLWAFEWLARHHPNVYIQVFELIPEYGRWDDLLLSAVHNNQVIPYVFQYIKIQIETDYLNMMMGKPISLCAKWLPTEGKCFFKHHRLQYNMLLTVMGFTPRQYRKRISSLRQYLSIVEHKLCNREWSTINYSNVPSVALHRLKKTFIRHDPERFKQWVEQGHINVSQLQPHQLVKNILNLSGMELRSTEEQWKSLVHETKKHGGFSKCIAVCDTSPSMYDSKCATKPIDVALSLSLLIASVSCTGKHIITFSDHPAWMKIQSELLADMVLELRKFPWGRTTNLEKVFELILHIGTFYDIPPEDMPQTLIILSDMQFNSASRWNQTNMDCIREKFQQSLYSMPSIIFWNVNGKYMDCPISQHDLAPVTIISGFSTNLLHYILTTDLTTLTPNTFFQNIINNPRYNLVRNKIS